MSVNYSKNIKSLIELGANGGALVSFQPHADTLTYEPFFGLSEKPFSLNADARFVYDSPTYSATRENLLAGIRRREGLLVLTGEIGAGKTTLCRSVLREVGRKIYSSMVPDPFASREDLLKMLLIDFGVLSIQELTSGPLRQASRTELGYLLSEFLNALSPDAFVVVIIDEAQNLSLPLIEEMRILSDTFGAQGRLQIVFVGQPELHAKLKLPEMRQVDQRVCGYHRLAPMDREAVSGYIQHRLQVAGGHRERVLFPPEVVDGLHRRSGGVPRLINRVCDRALHLAYERRSDAVNWEILETALLEVGSATLSPTWDSIIFAEPPAVAPTPTPTLTPTPAAVPAAPATVAVPPVAEDENFQQQIDNWVEQDLAPPSRPLRPHRPAVDEFAPESTSAARPKLPARKVVATASRERNSATYMQKFWRRWAKRAAIAVGALVAFNMTVVGASLLQELQAPPELPLLPTAPARAVAGLALIGTPLPGASLLEAPSAGSSRFEASRPDTSARVAAEVAGEYVVAVGLFASRERADQIVEALTQAGLPAMQRPVRLRLQEVQQIVLGPFFSRSDAVADLRRLQALGGYDDAGVVDSTQETSAQ